jgi:hypothetical protein
MLTYGNREVEEAQAEEISKRAVEGSKKERGTDEEASQESGEGREAEWRKRKADLRRAEEILLRMESEFKKKLEAVNRREERNKAMEEDMARRLEGIAIKEEEVNKRVKEMREKELQRREEAGEQAFNEAMEEMARRSRMLRTLSMKVIGACQNVLTWILGRFFFYFCEQFFCLQ